MYCSSTGNREGKNRDAWLHNQEPGFRPRYPRVHGRRETCFLALNLEGRRRRQIGPVKPPTPRILAGMALEFSSNLESPSSGACTLFFFATVCLAAKGIAAVLAPSSCDARRQHARYDGPHVPHAQLTDCQTPTCPQTDSPHTPISPHCKIKIPENH